MNVLNITILLSRLQQAKTNIDYAVFMLDDEDKEEAIAQQVEIEKLLNANLGDPEETFGNIINYLENNEAQVSALNESAVYISMASTAGQN